jgi:hypothetical protein
MTQRTSKDWLYEAEGLYDLAADLDHKFPGSLQAVERYAQANTAATIGLLIAATSQPKTTARVAKRGARASK